MPRVSITITGKNSQPYRFKLDREKVTIGRSSDSDIVVDCPSVSSLHATMERVEGGYILRDRKSTNGITLDDELMEIIDLRNDSDIKVGDVSFGYVLSEDELDLLDEEEFEPQEKKVEESSPEPKPKKKVVQKPLEVPVRKVSGVVSTPHPGLPAALPALASSNSGNGFLYGLGLIVCGAAAFYAGMDHSYKGMDINEDRKNFTLLSDIKDGRPPIPEKDEEK